MKCDGLICGYPDCDLTQEEHNRLMDRATWHLLWLIVLGAGILISMSVFMPEIK